jgi:MarR family transcriptional regulator, transcriptional regulator for hemolysin
MSTQRFGPPLGVRLTVVAGRATRAFEAALAAAGGSRPVWLILMSVKQGTDPGQSWLADQIGIRGATLTHHLAGMEERGLVTRERQAEDRRNQLVHLTADGEALFHRLRAVAQTFDAVLRGDLTDQETATLITLLGKVERNLPVD